MKTSLLDKLVGIFSPQAELRRIRARATKEFYQRSYDAAQTFKTDDWVSAARSSPNKEISAAQGTLRDKSRDAIRNNPYALHGLEVIVSNTVGAGIVPTIKGRDENHTQQLRAAWKTWAESTLCDAEGRRNYYGLQAAAMSSTVESGEVLGKKVLEKQDSPIVIPNLKRNASAVHKIQLIESDFIDSTKNIEGQIVQGIEISSTGKPVGYWLYKSHPGDGTPGAAVKVSAEEVVHVFKANRPGQKRGVTWFHAVIRLLEDLKNFQEATLIRQKIAACYAVFITSDPADSILSSEDLKAKRELESTIEPGIQRYLSPGEDIKFASPPGVENYADYCRQNLRAASAGLGITYESFTNDYSQVNFSSGRMGRLEMNRNIDMWRWQMLIPQFCEPTFKWFLEWCDLALGIKSEGVTVEWTPPAREMIDPTTEIEAIKRAIRTGIKTLPEAIREQGKDPEQVLKEHAEFNEKLDKYKLAFDSDARKMSSVGFAQAGDSFDKLNGTEPVGDTKSEPKD